MGQRTVICGDSMAWMATNTLPEDWAIVLAPPDPRHLSGEAFLSRVIELALKLLGIITVTDSV